MTCEWLPQLADAQLQDGSKEPRDSDVELRYTVQSMDAQGLYAHLCDKFLSGGFETLPLQQFAALGIHGVGTKSFQEVREQ